MATVGYADPEHAKGWALLHAATGFDSKASPVTGEPHPLLRTVEWAKTARPRLTAALRGNHPRAYRLLFSSPEPEPAPMFALRFLQHWKHLDADARATLERRGFHRAARKELGMI